MSAKGRKGRYSNSCTDQWLSDWNHKCSVRKSNLSYSVGAASPVLGDMASVSKIYLITSLSSEYFYPHLFWNKERFPHFFEKKGSITNLVGFRITQSGLEHSCLVLVLQWQCIFVCTQLVVQQEDVNKCC